MPCECDRSGWCERHQCEKSAHWFQLCHNEKFFQMWEEGRGPCKEDMPHSTPAVLNLGYEEKKKIMEGLTEDETVEASLLEQAMGFSKALFKHAKGGFEQVPDDVYEERLKICQSCPSRKYIHNNGNPRCKLCGCGLLKKLKWATEKCPVGHWFEHKENDPPSPEQT